MATEPTPARTPEREAFYERIAPANLAPLWEQRISDCAESHLRSVAAGPAQRPAAFGIEGPN